MPPISRPSRSWAIFPGTETLLLDMLGRGGAGTITAGANVNPRGLRAVWDAWQAGDEGGAKALQDKATALRQVVQSQAMVPSLKSILARGHGDEAWLRVRPPMVRLDVPKRTTQASALDQVGYDFGDRGMTARLAGKVAVVVGGGGGVGGATAKQLASEGAAVLVADQRADSAQGVAAAIVGAGDKAQAWSVDIADEASIRSMIGAALERMGSLDILVNAAAVPQVVPILKLTLADWQKVIDINLTGNFLCAQTAARVMAQRGTAGRIVNISSINAQRAIIGRGAYSVAKGGIAMLTKVMAAELGAQGITVNAVAPGPVDTEMVLAMHTQETRQAFHDSLAVKRYARPEEVAAAVAFLCSDEAAYITGHTLNVDGGFDAVGMIFDLGEKG